MSKKTDKLSLIEILEKAERSCTMQSGSAWHYTHNLIVEALQKAKEKEYTVEGRYRSL